MKSIHQASRTVIVAATAAVVLMTASGCGVRKAMYDQPKGRTLGKSDFFPDGRTARLPVPNTVARGQLHEDQHFTLGVEEGKPAERFPAPVTEATLERGHERFNVFCAPCHDRAGSGMGMVVQRGFKKPPSLHDPRLRAAPPGYFYTVIRNGFGSMPSYADQIGPEDRWAIAAYVRALQLSQNARMEDVPEAERAALRAEEAGERGDHGK